MDNIWPMYGHIYVYMYTYTYIIIYVDPMTQSNISNILYAPAQGSQRSLGILDPPYASKRRPRRSNGALGGAKRRPWAPPGRQKAPPRASFRPRWLQDRSKMVEDGATWRQGSARARPKVPNPYFYWSKRVFPKRLIRSGPAPSRLQVDHRPDQGLL